MPQNPNELLASHLRTLRLARGWSQEKMAEKCGLHRTYVGAIERGERNVTLQTLNALAVALGVSAAELIKDSHRERRGSQTS